jgi:CBS-domain-containing membrane protein
MWEPTVEVVMTKEVITARQQTPFKELVTLMNEHRVSGLPVVDRAGRPLGVVSEADTLVKQEHRAPTSRPVFGRRRKALWRRATGRTASELMTAPAVTVSTDATVTAAARLLAEKKIRRLCVVDADGVLAGVVSRRDVIGTFLRDDDAIRADIEERVFKKGMWLSPDSLSVVVSGGVATLDGEVERRTTAQIAGHLAQAIPGVVAVQNDLRYEVDDTVTSPL